MEWVGCGMGGLSFPPYFFQVVDPAARRDHPA